MNKNILNQLLGMFASSKGKSNEFDILKNLLSSFTVPEDLIRSIQTPEWIDAGFRRHGKGLENALPSLPAGILQDWTDKGFL